MNSSTTDGEGKLAAITDEIDAARNETEIIFKELSDRLKGTANYRASVS